MSVVDERSKFIREHAVRRDAEEWEGGLALGIYRTYPVQIRVSLVPRRGRVDMDIRNENFFVSFGEFRTGLRATSRGLCTYARVCVCVRERGAGRHCFLCLCFVSDREGFDCFLVEKEYFY